SSLALTRAKCRQRGFMRNRLPLAETARLKWFATASCQPSSAASRNDAARSTRSCHSTDSSLRPALRLVTLDMTPSRAKEIRARLAARERVYLQAPRHGHTPRSTLAQAPLTR